jgi:hypothetical protein
MGRAETPRTGRREAQSASRAPAGPQRTPSVREPAAPLVSGSPVSGSPVSESPVRATTAALAAAPRTLAAAAVLVAAEGLLLVGLGVWQVVRGFGHHIDNLGRAEFGGVLSLVCGVVVIGLARAQIVRRTTSRAPIVVIELLCLPVGWAVVENGLVGYGVPLLVVAVAVLALVAAASLRSRS